jgi:hypothetical protein
MDEFKIISVVAYSIGLVGWFLIWKFIIGYDWLKKEPLMHIPLWGGVIVLLINIFLTGISSTPSYEIEIGIYNYVEKNGITVAGFSMAIAVFVVLTFKDSINVLRHDESTQFLPLYWIPQVDGWLTVLRNLKTIPFLYSLFTLASAIVIYLHILKKDLKTKKLQDE